MKVLGARLLIKKVTKKTEGRIQIPTSGMSTVEADVVEAGPGIYQNGVLIPTQVQKGDSILYNGNGVEIIVEGERYQLIYENEVYCVIDRKEQ